MSCGCSSGSSYDGGIYGGVCDTDTPYPSVSHESVPSLIDNLVYALYGAITKDVTSGKVVWNIPCDPSNIPATINGIPRNDGEGLLCYIVRALNLTTPSGFVTVNGIQTLTNKTLTAPVINNAPITATGSTTARTLENRFADVVNVKDFGAKGDGTTDDTAAIQAAVNSLSLTGGTVFFPTGKFLVNSTVTISVRGISLVGNGFGSGGTWIVNGTTNAPAIQFGSGTRIYSNAISKMVFGQKAGVTAVSGNCGVYVNSCSGLSVSQIQTFMYPSSLYDGIVLNNTFQSRLDSLELQNSLNSGIKILNGIDIFVSNSRCDANAYGWVLVDSQGCYFTNCTAIREHSLHFRKFESFRRK
jgi:hypothetical protein